MRKLTTAVLALGLLLLAPSAWAGSAHFITNAFTLTRTDTTLTVTGKEAGLGDEPQVHVVLSATAQCVNPGGNKPSAGNKQSLSAEGDFPVQNGRAEFELSVTAVFQPNCSPPMSVQYTDVTVTDTTSGISYTFPGTY